MLNWRISWLSRKGSHQPPERSAFGHSMAAAEMSQKINVQAQLPPKSELKHQLGAAHASCVENVRGSPKIAAWRTLALHVGHAGMSAPMGGS